MLIKMMRISQNNHISRLSTILLAFICLNFGQCQLMFMQNINTNDYTKNANTPINNQPIPQQKNASNGFLEANRTNIGISNSQQNIRQSFRQSLRQSLMSGVNSGSSRMVITPSATSTSASVIQLTPSSSQSSQPSAALSYTDLQPQQQPTYWYQQPSQPSQSYSQQPAYQYSQPGNNQDANLQTSVPPTPQSQPSTFIENSVSANSSSSILTPTQQSILSSLKTESSKMSQSVSFDQIFTKLPKPSQLDSLILAADSFPLLKAIQQASISNLSCQQKNSYLSDFFGRINSAVNMKKYINVQLKVVIQSAVDQVNRLNNQISQSKNNVQRVGLVSMRTRLNQSLSQLSQSYNIYNKVSQQISPKQQEINRIISQIQTIKQQSTQLRQQLPQQRTKLVELSTTVSVLEQQLSQAKSKKALQQAYLNKMESDIKQFDGQIRKNQDRKAIAEMELARTIKQFDARKANYKIIQVDVERLRKDISEAQRKIGSLGDTINSLQDKITTQNKKLAYDVVKKNQELISDLSAIIPTVQQKIDETNYQCNQVKQFETIKNSQQTIYILSPKDFNSYLQASYKITRNTFNLLPIKTQLTPISIQSRAWQLAYGNPFLSAQLGILNGSYSFTYKQDFNCLEPGSLETGYGRVLAINKRFLQVQDKGIKYKLNLGACTRLQSTSTLPHIGQQMYYRGKRISKGEFNIYKGSCF